MLPIVDKPLIQYAVEEAVAGGITDIIFVVADGKEAIEEHFGSGGRLEGALSAAGNAEMLSHVRRPAALARFSYYRQDRPLGIAHALNCAREAVEGEPFALLFPDDLLISARPVVAQMMDAYEDCAGSLLAVQPVAEADVHQYGIVDPDSDGNPARLRGIVEKPSIAEAPSRLGVVGRYIIGPTIFDHIARLKPGKNGELQLTDALASQIAAGECVCAFTYEGTRYDTGRPLGFIVANVGAAMAREDLRGPLAAQLRTVLPPESR
jgi:UTP--glucose-1-phosphate uridylyltransferase